MQRPESSDTDNGMDTSGHQRLSSDTGKPSDASGSMTGLGEQSQRPEENTSSSKISDTFREEFASQEPSSGSNEADPDDRSLPEDCSNSSPDISSEPRAELSLSEIPASSLATNSQTAVDANVITPTLTAPSYMSGLLVPPRMTPRERRIATTNDAYASTATPTLLVSVATSSSSTTAGTQASTLLLLPAELRHRIWYFAIPQITEIDLCPCIINGVTDCATTLHIMSEQLQDTTPALTIRQVNRFLRLDTLEMVRNSRMKSLHVCSPVCLNRALRLCSYEQLIRIYRIDVYVDHQFILTPATRLGWYVTYASMYKIYEASKRVAECFFQVDELSSFNALAAVFISGHVAGMPPLPSDIGFLPRPGSARMFPVPRTTMRSIASAHCECYRSGRGLSDPLQA
jgi:hypothetical protein